jgi:hypothetical protein
VENYFLSSSAGTSGRWVHTELVVETNAIAIAARNPLDSFAMILFMIVPPFQKIDHFI